MKERLDVLLVQRGHAASREKAKAVIMAGCVYVRHPQSRLLPLRSEAYSP